MTRRRHSARGLAMAQTALCDVPDDIRTSRKPASPWQTRHGAGGVGAGFELRAVKEVQDIFRGVIDDDTTLNVLEACNYDSEKATSILCEGNAAKPSRRVEEDPVHQHARTNLSGSTDTYSGPCLWEFLPLECKLQVNSPHCNPGQAQSGMRYVPFLFCMPSQCSCSF